MELVSKAWKRELIDLLKAAGFAEIETLEQQLERFTENAPVEETSLTEDEIQRKIHALRAPVS